MTGSRTPLGDAGTPPEEGELIARLLQAAGPRPDASTEAKERVKAVVHARWRESVRARRRLRLLAWCAGTIAAAIVVIIVALGYRRGVVVPLGPQEPAGTLILLSAGALRGPDGAAVLPGSGIAAGSVLETGPDARAAIHLSGGADIRLDAGTRITLQGGSLLDLERGAVYVDSGGAEGRPGNLEIRTEIGKVRDVGTQFEVRVNDRELKVRVRHGSVKVDRPGRAEGVSAGSELTVDAAGISRIETLPQNGSAWDWILGVAPEFELEGRTLGQFLGWVSSETGLRVTFSSATVERESLGIVLHGSVAGLRPDQAPEAVLPTCGLSHRVVGDTLVVSRESAEGSVR